MTDILATIDAAVEQHCACGCGRPLDPDGPSGWFATDACQWRWHNRQATNPVDVYNRPDANSDNIDLPVRRPRPVEGDHHPRTGYVYQPWQPAPLLRHCRRCGTSGPPGAGVRLIGTVSRDTIGDYRPVQTELAQVCPNCRSPYPGPLLTAVRYDDFERDQIVVRLHDSTNYVQVRVHQETPIQLRDPASFWANVFRKLEAQLAESWPDEPGPRDDPPDVEGVAHWQGGHLGGGRTYAETTAAILRQFGATLEPGLRRLAEQVGEWGAGWRAIAEQVVEPRSRPEPSDPRERALAHLRGRNTGPRQRPRPPRRIDPSSR